MEYNQIEKMDIKMLIRQNQALVNKLQVLRTQLKEDQNKDSNLNGTSQNSQETTKLRREKETLLFRIKTLSEYNNQEVEDLINNSDFTKNQSYECFCGGSNIVKLTDSLQNKVLAQSQSVSVCKADKGKTDAQAIQKNSETCSDLENTVAIKEKIIEELMAKMEEMRFNMETMKISKKSLDSKFFKSKLVQRLVQQVKELLDYSNDQHRRQEESYTNLNEIEKIRSFELKDLQNKEAEIKEKQSLELAVVRRDQQMYKDRSESNMDLEKIGLNNKNNDAEIIKQSKIVTDLNKHCSNQTSKIKELMKQFDEERSRVNKYHKELVSVKEKNYEQLQSKYGDMPNAVMRHLRYQEMFKKFYELDEKHEQGIKDNLDEIKKYVNSRDDKVNYQEKKVKRLEKELESERTRSKDYQTEIETTAVSFDEINEQYNAKSSEIKECNHNFNKLYKEKHNEKLNYQQELNVLNAKIKNSSESLHHQYELAKELTKKIELLESHIKELEVSNWRQRKELEDLLSDKTNLLQDKEGESVKKDIFDQKQEALENSIKQNSKEISLLRKDATEKSKMLEQFLKASRAGEQLDQKDLSQEQIIYERMELKRMRRLLTCPVCEKKEKDVIIMKCFHTFCDDCIKSCLNHRERKCPVCMIKISQADVKKMFLETL